MGYIRDDFDYYIASGMSYDSAKRQVARDNRGYNKIDYGYCNPIKSKIADEEEKEINHQIDMEN
jgi:hypothetical protein